MVLRKTTARIASQVPLGERGGVLRRVDGEAILLPELPDRGDSGLDGAVAEAGRLREDEDVWLPELRGGDGRIREQGHGESEMSEHPGRLGHGVQIRIVWDGLFGLSRTRCRRRLRPHDEGRPGAPLGKDASTFNGNPWGILVAVDFTSAATKAHLERFTFAQSKIEFKHVLNRTAHSGAKARQPIGPRRGTRRDSRA